MTPPRARMRLAVALVLSIVLTGSLGAGAMDVVAPSVRAATLPALDDALVGDALLTYVLAREAGHEGLSWPPRRVVVPADLTLPDMVHALAMRAGVADQLAPGDLDAFAELDPRVAAPVLLLLVAMDEAWTLRDQAFAALSPEEREEFYRLARDHHIHDERYLQLRAQIDWTPLLEGTIVLLDTLDNHVMPLLDELADSDAWPAAGAWDPVGILRIGSTGDDYETTNRILQIDPRGNDKHHNNAGGTTILADLNPLTYDTPVALSIDLRGNDHYDNTLPGPAQGGGNSGIGIMLDREGNDSYTCGRYCQGAGADGFGLHRDDSGNDTRRAGILSTGYAQLLGILRDTGGNDMYFVGAWAGAYAEGLSAHPHAVGLLWDRGGTDRYGFESNYHVYGWARQGNRGWLVDEGPEHDVYEVDFDHGCNDCLWRAGRGGLIHTQPEGRGSDNMGGLVPLLRDELAQILLSGG